MRRKLRSMFFSALKTHIYNILHLPPDTHWHLSSITTQYRKNRKRNGARVNTKLEKWLNDWGNSFKSNKWCHRFSGERYNSQSLGFLEGNLDLGWKESFILRSNVTVGITGLRETSDLGLVSRKPRNLFAPGMSLQNLKPYDSKAVLFTFSQ